MANLYTRLEIQDENNQAFVISVRQNTPNYYSVHIEKWPDDVKEACKLLYYTESALHEGFKQLIKELELR